MYALSPRLNATRNSIHLCATRFDYLSDGGGGNANSLKRRHNRNVSRLDEMKRNAIGNSEFRETAIGIRFYTSKGIVFYDDYRVRDKVIRL